MLGITTAAHADSNDATQVLPPLADQRVSEATMLEDAFRRLMEGDDEPAKKDVSERIQRAHKGVKERIRTRSNSMTATLVFIGFLVAAQVAIIIGNLHGFDKLATKPTIVGLLAIFWGMLPTFGNLFPGHRGDEGVDALAKTEFDWFCEDVSRSSSQRQQLWRLRVAMAIALTWTSVTLVLFFFT
jgi:hypothetical protein